jgi:hypothetical protein
MQREHTPPGDDCSCGFYAYYDPLIYNSGHGSLQAPYGVTGVASAWGDVVLHAFGWRAQYARVEAIFHDPLLPEYGMREAKEEIAREYGVEVISPIDFEDFCISCNLAIIDED